MIWATIQKIRLAAGLPVWRVVVFEDLEDDSGASVTDIIETRRGKRHAKRFAREIGATGVITKLEDAAPETGIQNLRQLNSAFSGINHHVND